MSQVVDTPPEISLAGTNGSDIGTYRLAECTEDGASPGDVDVVGVPLDTPHFHRRFRDEADESPSLDRPAEPIRWLP